MKFLRLILAVFILTVVSANLVDAQEKKLKIAVIPKGTTHEFWKTIHAGALKAEKELGVEIIWQGPEKEDDRQMQIQVVQNFISRGVDAICLAPLDDVALARPVQSAVKRKIPVIIIDSGLKSKAHSSFVATDNKEGGRMGARRLAKVLDGKGKIIMMRYSEGSASTINREAGFLEEIKKHPGIEIVSSNQYAGATKEEAFKTATNLLNRYAKELNGIFCSNESATFGMLRALETTNRTKKFKFVGFDTSPTLLAAMKEGKIHGLVSQDPFDMGYKGVVTAVKVIRGEKVEKRIATRLLMVTKENLNDPDVKDVINPPLDKYFGKKK